MAHANLKSSKRLKKLHRALSRRKWQNTQDLMQKTWLVAVSTAISELRQNGVKILKRRNDKGWIEWRLG